MEEFSDTSTAMVDAVDRRRCHRASEVGCHEMLHSERVVARDAIYRLTF